MKNMFYAYRIISCNERPRRLFNFEGLRFGAYWRAALIGGRRLLEGGAY